MRERENAERARNQEEKNMRDNQAHHAVYIYLTDLHANAKIHLSD